MPACAAQLLLNALERDGTSLDLNRVDLGPHILGAEARQLLDEIEGGEGTAGGGAGIAAAPPPAAAAAAASGGAGSSASDDGQRDTRGSGTKGRATRGTGRRSSTQAGGWESAEERALELARTYHGLGQARCPANTHI